MKQLIELVRKDIRLYLADRSAAIISLVVPIGIASFLTLISSSASDDTTPKPITVAVTDLDQSPGSKLIIKKLQGESRLKIEEHTLEESQSLTKSGKLAFALVIPKNFSADAIAATTGGPKPDLTALEDPSQRIAVMASQGTVTGATVAAILDEANGVSALEQGMDEHLPFKFKDVLQAGDAKIDQSAVGRAHVFAGMAVQGVLFFAINLAMGIMKDRRLGIWKRLRAAPVTAAKLVLGKTVSGSLIGLSTLVAIFVFGFGAMGVRMNGSAIGFALLLVITAVFSATFGLLVASLGKTEDQSRGLSIFFVLSLSMLGGAWFPMFLMPQWIQTATLAIPTRWAIDGFDGVLWRGFSLTQSLPMVVVLMAFSTVFFAIAADRLKRLDLKS